MGITEGRLWRDVKSTAERRMKGCAVILNRLIDSVIWLKCKDEGRRRKTGLVRGIFICPTWKRCRAFKKRWWSFEETHRTLSKTYPAFSKTHRAFLKTSRSFCSTLCGMPVLFNVCMYASFNTYGGVSLHVRTHEPTRIYASTYADVRISPHIYMSLWQAPSYPVSGLDSFVPPSGSAISHPKIRPICLPFTTEAFYQ